MPFNFSNSKKRYLLLACLIVAGIAIFLTPFFIQGLKESSYFLSSSRTSLEEKYEKLRKENLRLKLRISHLNSILEENKRLKRLLELKEKHTRLLAAKVIGTSPVQWQKEVIIDKGRKKGVKKGDIVIDYQGNLVGKVERLKDNTSWVLLSSDPNFKISAYCRDLRVILKGSLFKEARLLYVPFDYQIKPGDKIYTSVDFFDGLPIAIGEVSSVEKKEGSLTQTVFVRLYCTRKLLKEVLVLTRPEEVP